MFIGTHDHTYPLIRGKIDMDGLLYNMLHTTSCVMYSSGFYIANDCTLGHSIGPYRIHAEKTVPIVRGKQLSHRFI